MRLGCSGVPSLIVLIGAAWGAADEFPVYYDYVEDGELRGGRFMIDPANPVHRAEFGLDDAGPAVRGWAVTTVINSGPTENRDTWGSPISGGRSSGGGVCRSP